MAKITNPYTGEALGAAEGRKTRLIDANRTKRIIQEEIEKSDFPLFKGVMRMLCDILDHSPTVDAVEVVRCKDCHNCTKSKWCNLLMMDVKDDVFCSYGKRKDRGDDHGGGTKV